MNTKCACLLVAAMLFSNTARATLIDFDDGVAGDIIDGRYVDRGVRFANAVRVSNFGLNGFSGPYGISAIGAFQWLSDNPIVAYFSKAVTDVSFVGIDVGDNGLRLDAYDAEAGGNLIDFAQVFGENLGNNQFFMLAVNAKLIKRVEIYQIQQVSIDGIVIEDLRFSAVPLPASGLLMAIGLSGWRLLNRRSQQCLRIDTSLNA
ncbi:hypothetical protein QZJ86_18885 [Methylomonas montana]|uniref:hypothetical protein n=1 Tax=Methylomonas montana TaxID=3058963 RepID=UPI002657B59E|nr:hypothetical protein [Methylomonas montana]WKJ90050.1 hypothetical protein QZJ86_18885 [Methylomonas montana]